MDLKQLLNQLGVCVIFTCAILVLCIEDLLLYLVKRLPLPYFILVNLVCLVILFIIGRCRSSPVVSSYPYASSSSSYSSNSNSA